MVFRIIESFHRIHNDGKEVELMETAGLIWMLLPLPRDNCTRSTETFRKYEW